MVSFFRRHTRKTTDSPCASRETDYQIIEIDAYKFQLLPLPDGEYIFTSDWKNGLHLHSSHTGNRLRSYMGHTSKVFSIAPLGDDIFASISSDAILVHRISDGVMLDRFEFNVGFGSTDSEPVVFSSAIGGIVLEMHWDETSKLRLKRSLDVVADGISGLYNVSVCGTHFAIVSSRKHNVTVREVSSFEPVGTMNIHLPSCIHLTDLVLVIGCYSGEILVYNAPTLGLIRKMRIHSRKVNSVLVMADSRHLLSCAEDGLISIHDIKTDTQMWQKNFNIEVCDATLSSDGRLVTRFANGVVLLHSIPRDLVQTIMTRVILPSTPLRDALEKVVSGGELPEKHCKELITFERCRASFEEWCSAHLLLMMAVEDGDIERSGDYNDEIGWFFENIYLAAKNVEITSQDDHWAMKRFLVQATAAGVLEGIDTVLAAIRLTQDFKAEVSILKRADILMLERVLSIEARLDKLKHAFDRYRKYMRNSQLLGVALADTTDCRRVGCRGFVCRG